MPRTIYAEALRAVADGTGFDDEVAALLSSLLTGDPVALRGHYTVIPAKKLHGALGRVAEAPNASLALRTAVNRLRHARWATTVGSARPSGPVLDVVALSANTRFVEYRFSDRFLACLRYHSLGDHAGAGALLPG